jgi:hypothetical protein
MPGMLGMLRMLGMLGTLGTLRMLGILGMLGMLYDTLYNKSFSINRDRLRSSKEKVESLQLSRESFNIKRLHHLVLTNKQSLIYLPYACHHTMLL